MTILRSKKSNDKMKKIVLVLAFVAVLAGLMSCKSMLPSRFERFVDRVEKEAPNYTEQDWEKASKKFESLVSEYKKSYLNSNFISLLSERDYSNRKNELEELVTQSESMLKKYNKFLTERFGPNFNQNDFQEVQFDNHEQRMIYQKKKLQEQDDMIDSMISINNENRQISKEMGNNIGKQNSLLDKVQKDIDFLNDKMNNSNTKITNFLAKSSYCKLYIIAFVQAIIIILLII